MLIALRYRRYFGAWLVAAGIALNLIPMVAHGGLMPVSYDVVAESKAFPEITPNDIGRQLSNGKDIVLNPDDIHLSWLADRFILDLPGYGTNIYSLGDFVLFSGIGLAILQVVATAVWTVSSRQRPQGSVSPPSDSNGR